MSDSGDSGNAFLAKLLEVMPGNVYWKDREGRALGCNLNMANILGLSSPREIVGKRNCELFDLELARVTDTIDQQVMLSETTYTIEEFGIDIDGQPATYLSTKTPLYDDDGQVTGLLGMSIDITERKKVGRLAMEQVKAEQKIKMQQATEYLRMAMRAVAHDIRTPLASIKFALTGIDQVFSQLLEAYKLAEKNGLIKSPIRSQKIDLFEGAVHRSLREIDNANIHIDLTLANSRYDQFDLTRYQTHTVKPIIEYCLATYPFKDHEQDLVHWVDGSDFNFHGHDVHLRNVLNNLIRNALFYIQKARKGEIFITLTQGADRNCIRFKDTAEGASKDVCDRLFDSYFTTRDNATGLGLAYCKAVMQSFDGDITAESVEGEYMSFCISFPAVSDV